MLGLKKYSRNPIDIPWSPTVAYAVGLITTDGCLSPDRRHIDFTSKDFQLTETFKTCLGLETKTRLKSSSSSAEKKYFSVQFGNVVFYRWLEKIGLTRKKSLTLGVLDIPDQFFFDFLRGCFDGDGSVYAYWDPRWHSSYMFYIHFVSASRAHLEWLQKTTQRLGEVSGKIRQGKRCYQLTFAKRESKILFQKMFYVENLPCLERKKQKAEGFFVIDEIHNARVSKLVDDHA